MILFSQIHADCFQSLSCPLYVWKWLLRLSAPLLSQGLKQGCWAYSSSDLPSWRVIFTVSHSSETFFVHDRGTQDGPHSDMGHFLSNSACVPPVPMDLSTSSLFKYSPTCLASDFSVVAEAWNSGQTSVKSKAEKTLSTSCLSCLLSLDPLPYSVADCHLPLSSFCRW